jgi:hypothetical protein
MASGTSGRAGGSTIARPRQRPGDGGNVGAVVPASASVVMARSVEVV